MKKKFKKIFSMKMKKNKLKLKAMNINTAIKF
jgi:hypothetical protein